MGGGNFRFRPAERENNAISGYDADPDHDGWNNLIEYTCLTNPKVSNSQSPPVVAGSVTLTGHKYQILSYRKRAQNIEFAMIPEIASNLTQWLHGPDHLIPHGDPITNPDGSQTVSFRSITPIGGKTREFLRLRVTHSP